MLPSCTRGATEVQLGRSILEAMLRPHTFDSFLPRLASGQLQRRRVLVTGAATPIGTALLACAEPGALDLWAGDVVSAHIDDELVAPNRRVVVPAASDEGFADRMLILCCENAIDVVVPTGADEQRALRATTWQFSASGIAVVTPAQIHDRLTLLPPTAKAS